MSEYPRLSDEHLSALRTDAVESLLETLALAGDQRRTAAMFAATAQGRYSLALAERFIRDNPLPDLSQPERMMPGQRSCACSHCNPDAWWMVVCATCGNKRCPHATHHDNTCTRSNEPGQTGSRYS